MCTDTCRPTQSQINCVLAHHSEFLGAQETHTELKDVLQLMLDGMLDSITDIKALALYPPPWEDGMYTSIQVKYTSLYSQVLSIMSLLLELYRRAGRFDVRCRSSIQLVFRGIFNSPYQLIQEIQLSTSSLFI